MNITKEQKTNKRLIWIAFISSVILFLLALKFVFSALPNKDNIVEIKGVINDNIKIKKGSRGKRSLIIKLQEYPSIDFAIERVSLKQTYAQELINNNKPGDSITLFVEQKEYNRKIAKTEKTPFPENFWNNDRISVVEISNKTSNYLLLEDYINEHKKNNYESCAFFGFFGILMSFLGVKGIIFYKKKFVKTN